MSYKFMLAAAGLLLGKPNLGSTPKPKKGVKNCLECGKGHKHNNSYCSPECCKKHREGLKNGKKADK